MCRALQHGAALLLGAHVLSGPCAAAQEDGAGAALGSVVPYLAQSEALCGGAAAAMVMRYWGARGVQPDDFAPLLNTRRDGIEASRLVDALTHRGWRAFAFDATLEGLTHHLSRGRPLVALIRAGSNRFHYVVVTDVSAQRVIFHDPAAGPAQALSTHEFDSAWRTTSRLALLILPSTSVQPVAVADRKPARAPAACVASLDRAQASVAAGDLAGTERHLADARATCPDASAPWRELAGLRLRQRQPAVAARLAREALARDPADAHAWRVLGTAEFLQRDAVEALRAWNHAGEPVSDLVRVDGLKRIRYRVVTDRLAFPTGRVITPEQVDVARRRLAAMPALAASRVDVVPVGGGLAEVEAAVVERPLLPRSTLSLTTLGVRGLIHRETVMSVTSPTGHGEQLDASARWWESRPAVGVSLHLPLNHGPLRGMLRLSGAAVRESYAIASRSEVSVEDRRLASVTLSDWVRRGFAWETTLRADRWTGRPLLFGLGAAVEQRAAGDRLALRLQTDVWPAGAFGVGTMGMRWRDRPQGGERLRASLNVVAASTSAPRSFWTGAGTGHGRPYLLRAHPLLDDGALVEDRMGRRLVHGGIEARREIRRLGPVRLAAAIFLDAAITSRGDAPSHRHVDAGVGVRLRVPGEGTLRLDFARALTDGAHALSAGWELPWPTWP